MTDTTLSGEPQTPTINEILAYENGEMTQDDVVSFFQRLVDSGLAWKLQGSYGRAAHHLIKEGLVFLPGGAT